MIWVVKIDDNDNDDGDNDEDDDYDCVRYDDGIAYSNNYDDELKI